MISLKTTFIIKCIHEKADNKMYGVVCIMFGITNKNYVKRPDSNSYLGQQSLGYRTSRYVTRPCPRFIMGRGARTCSHILGKICCVGRHTVYTRVLCRTF